MHIKRGIVWLKTHDWTPRVVPLELLRHPVKKDLILAANSNKKIYKESYHKLKTKASKNEDIYIFLPFFYMLKIEIFSK